VSASPLPPQFSFTRGWWTLLIATNDSSETAPTPVISVVIAARNEEPLIEECLAAVCGQEIQAPYEVIVVDNNSSDLTAIVASRFPCRVVTEPRHGQLMAKSSGVEAARGAIVAILDADCIPDVTWLANVHAAMNATAHKPMAVTCCYRYGALPWWGYTFVLISRLIFVSGSRVLFGTLPFVIGGNVAFRRDALHCEGGYPTSGGIAETELGLAGKLGRRGAVRYLPSMMVWSSARQFHRGFGSFLLDYKLKEYVLPYLRRGSWAMSLRAQKNL